MKVKELVEVIKKTNKELQIVAMFDGQEIGLESTWRNDGPGWEEFCFVMREDKRGWSMIDICMAKHALQYETEMNPIDLFSDESNILEYEFRVNEVVGKCLERSYAVEKIEVGNKVYLYLTNDEPEEEEDSHE